MKLFRIIMGLHYTSGAYSGTNHLPAFYVHAIDGEHAQCMALAVANCDSRFKRTSGSAIAVDANLDLIKNTYYSWSDL